VRKKKKGKEEKKKQRRKEVANTGIVSIKGQETFKFLQIPLLERGVGHGKKRGGNRTKKRGKNGRPPNTITKKE